MKQVHIKPLIIAYGSENVTLNKGGEHMTLTNKDMASIAESVLRNMSVKISITNQP